MSRLSGLFGGLYRDDRYNRGNTVTNQVTGPAGQAASFAAAQESERARQAQQLAEAQAAANQQQQAIAAEATAAQQRQTDARNQATQEQELKLREAQFQNDRAIETQKLAESKRAALATEAYRQNQNRLSTPNPRGSNPLRELQFGSLTSSSSNKAPMGSAPGNILLAGRQAGHMIHQQLGLSSARAGSAYNAESAARRLQGLGPVGDNQRNQIAVSRSNGAFGPSRIR